MAPPKTFEEAVALIFDRCKPLAMEPTDVIRRAVENTFQEFKSQYPFMHDKSLLDAYKCEGDRNRIKNYQARFAPPPPDSLLWDAVMNLDAHASHGSHKIPTEAWKLEFLVRSDKFPLIPL